MTATRNVISELVQQRPRRAVLEVSGGELVAGATLLFASGYRLALVAAHDDSDGLRVVYLFVDGPPDQRVELHVRLSRDQPRVTSLAHLSFPAGRFEREMRDLFGIEPVGHPQARPLVLHQHWSPEWHPLRHDAGVQPPMTSDAPTYPFAEIRGPGLYEIPVGPVHAGVIEPGHFRFWVMGETIVKMKARLWFTHKGVEQLFEGRDVSSAVELAERISGDSAVSHSLAFCLAVEEALGIDVPQRARELRALLLELERLYNHVADVGALCNDAGFSLANARALVVRERLLQINDAVVGHRLLRGGVRVGGVMLRRLPPLDSLREIGERFHELLAVARANSIVMDRFRGTGVLTIDQAREIGVLGVVARASGLERDARVAHPFIASTSSMPMGGPREGDVLARFSVRAEQFDESLALVQEYGSRDGALSSDAPTQRREWLGHGTGIVEGWRGTVVHRVEVDSSERMTRVKVVDPSFLTWPALAVALADTIVPDFPLVNKSFNLSYAGNDL